MHHPREPWGCQVLYWSSVWPLQPQAQLGYHLRTVYLTGPYNIVLHQNPVLVKRFIIITEMLYIQLLLYVLNAIIWIYPDISYCSSSMRVLSLAFQAVFLICIIIMTPVSISLCEMPSEISARRVDVCHYLQEIQVTRPEHSALYGFVLHKLYILAVIWVALYGHCWATVMGQKLGWRIINPFRSNVDFNLLSA